jgi:hypothetical protein
MKKLRQIGMLLLVVSMSSILLTSFVNAASPPQPTYGVATVDGDISEWDLVNDFFVNMTRAGRPDKPLEANVSLRMDCINYVLYVLVLTQPEVPGILSPADAWAAINVISNKTYHGDSVDDGVPPDFAWVGVGYDGNSSHVQGYEASFPLDCPNSYNIKIHIEVFDDSAWQTAATLDFIPLLLICPTVIPEVPIGSVIAVTSMMVALVVYFEIRSRSRFRLPEV